MNWTEKYTRTVRKKTALGTVAIVVLVWTNTAGAEEPHVHLYVPTMFPGCNDPRYFRDQFRKSLETRDWEFPDGQAPNIALWIRKETELHTLSFHLLIIPYGKAPWSTREIRSFTECSRLVSDAASIAAEMLRPPPTRSILLAAQWNTGVFPNPWVPAIYFQGGTTLPKRPNLTVYAGISVTPTYSWTPPQTPNDAGNPEIRMWLGTGLTSGFHRTFGKLELGAEFTVGMLYLEQVRPKPSADQTPDHTASYALVGPRIGYRFQWNNQVQLYFGATLSGSLTRPLIRPSARSQSTLFEGDRLSATLIVGGYL